MSAPRANPEVSAGPARLDSWKQIAAYLGRSERTVRRWEQNEGLPVHRLQHEQRGSVYAYRSELDAWWESRKPSLEAVLPAAPPAPVVISRKPNWILAATAIGLLAIVAVVLGLRGPAARPVVSSILVLPFNNLSPSSTEDWFSDGMTEALITELAKVRRLKVISRTTAMHYKNAKKPLKQIAAEAGVDAVVEGSAMLTGNQVRITAQLIQATTDAHLWSSAFDREISDVLGLQHEVAEAIAHSVGAAVAPHRTRAANPEAMAAYLKGLYQFNRTELSMARDFAREGIRLDPQMARCHELLGMTLLLTADFHRTTYASIMPEARASLDRALELDPESAMSLSWLGWSYFAYEHDWRKGEDKMRRAIELDPVTGNNYAFLLAGRGQFDEAIRAVDRAVEYDPANPSLLADAAQIHHFARRYREAIGLYRKAIELNPTSSYARIHIVKSLLLAGSNDEAFEAWLWTPHGLGPLRMGTQFRDLYRSGGWPAVWRTYIEQRPLDLVVLIQLGRKQEALDVLEALEKKSDSWMVQLEDPVYDPLRQDPRFKALLRRTGYPSGMWR